MKKEGFDTMESRREQAIAHFKEGYNCTQAVVLAHLDLLGIDKEQAMKLCQSFGGGMGRLRQVCGTVSGMFFVAGALTGSGEPRDMESKKTNYEAVQKLAAEFEKKNGSIICATLLGLDRKDGRNTVDKKYQTGAAPEPRTEEYYKKRPCLELIGDACDILAGYFS